METVLFSDTAFVRVQGDDALEYFGRVGDHLEFQLKGFSDPAIFIEDYRPGIEAGVKHFFETGSNECLLRRLNSQAHTTVLLRKNGDLVVRLEPPLANTIRFFFWAAVGIQESIPAYNYLIWEISQLSEGRYGLFAVFESATVPLEQWTDSAQELCLEDVQS